MRIDAPWQLIQYILALGGFQRRQHLLARGARARGADVLQNGRFEQAAVLEHECHLFHQHMGVDLLYVHAADLHRAGRSVPEAGDEAGGRGFATAGGAYQRHRLSRLGGEGDMGEGGHVRAVVGKAHVLERHLVAMRPLRMGGRLQRRGVHHLIDAAQRGVRKHHARRCEHDARQRRGDDGGEHRVKGEVGHEPGKAAAGQRPGREEQGCGNQKDERALGKRQVDGLRHAADVRLPVFRLGAVFLDGFFERLEGIHRLLEDLHHGNAAHVLRARLADAVQRRLIFSHDFRVLAAHHREHGDHRDHRRQHAGRAHPPVKHEHQHQHGDEEHNGAHDVRQVVRQQRLGIGRRRVQPPADEAGGVRVEIPQRRFHHVRHAPLADVGRRTERRQMRAHQPREIDGDTAHGKGKGQPAIAADALRRHPVRRHGDEVARRQPDTDVRREAHQHGHRRQAKSQKGQALSAPRVIQQNRYVAFFPLFHSNVPSLIVR